MAGIGLAKPKMMTPSMKVNPSHPLAQDLLFFRASGASLGRQAGTQLTFIGTPYGKAISSAGSSAWAVQAPKIPTRHNWTMHTVVRLASSDVYTPIFAMPADPQNGSWGSPYHALSFMRDFNTNSGHFGTNISGSYNSYTVAGTIVLFDNLWHAYTASSGTLGAIIYRDGVQVATSATTPNGANATTPQVIGTPEVVFCGRSASTAGAEHYTGTGVLQAAWNRRLSAQEAALMAQDPFCMFGG